MHLSYPSRFTVFCILILFLFVGNAPVFAQISATYKIVLFEEFEYPYPSSVSRYGVNHYAIPLQQLDAGGEVELIPFRCTPQKCFPYQTGDEEYRKLKVYRRGDTSLYDDIKKGLTIAYTYIEELDLARVARIQNDSTIIAYPLKFANCIIAELKYTSATGGISTGEDSMVTVFKDSVYFNSCALLRLRLKNVRFQKYFGIFNPVPAKPPAEYLNDQRNAMYFKGMVERGQAGTVIIIVEDAVFDGGFEFINTLGRHNDNPDTIWRRQFPDFYGAMSFIDCNFEKASITNNYKNYTLLFQDAVFADSFDVDRQVYSHDTLYNMLLPGCTFKTYAAFGEHLFLNEDFSNAKFSGTINLVRTRFADSSVAFEEAHFSEGVTCLLDPSKFSLKNLNFSMASIQKLNFPYVLDGVFLNLDDDAFKISEEVHDDIQNFYADLKADAEQVYAKNGTYEKLEPAYSHTALLYHIQFLKNSAPAFSGKYLQYIWLSIKEQLVGNGYKGEDRFFKWLFVIVLVFGVVYYVRYREVTVMSLNDDSHNFSKEDCAKPGLKNFLICFWVSFLVLINPRFPKKYFQNNGNLFGIICLEWFLGFILMILFLIHIAVSYPFVKILLGI